MIKVYKLTKFSALDKILPLLAEFKEKDGFLKNYSMAGIYSQLLLNFFNNEHSIWTAEENGDILGFIIAGINYKYFEKHCHIEMAYMKRANMEASSAGFDMVFDWAKENGCKFMTCYSQRANLLSRKYKFDIVTDFLTLRIGD